MINYCMSEDEENKEQTSDDEPSKTEINASLAALDISVSTEGQDECEELFYRVWDYVSEDAEEMSDALREHIS
jgi:hypothetical protein